MGVILKEVFISSIEAIRLQQHKDSLSADLIGKVFNTDSVNPYDTSLVTLAIIQLLQVFFPKDENGFCEISHYCFDMNFGKIDGMELITPEDLWDRLVYDSDPVSRVLQDEAGMWPKSYIDSFVDEVEYWLAPTITSTHPLIDDKK